MAEILKNPLPDCLHYESHPAKSREQLTVTAATKAGDLLVLTSAGFTPFAGAALTPKADAKGIVVAVALADGAANAAIPCVVRDAVILQDRLNQVGNDAFDAGKPLAAIAPLLEAQQLVVTLSIAAQPGAKA